MKESIYVPDGRHSLSSRGGAGDRRAMHSCKRGRDSPKSHVRRWLCASALLKPRRIRHQMLKWPARELSGIRSEGLPDPFPQIFLYYLSFFTLELTLCVLVRNWVNSLCLGRRTKLSCTFSSSSNLPFENLLGFHLTELHSSAFEREDVSERVSSESWAGVGGLVSQPLV